MNYTECAESCLQKSDFDRLNKIKKIDTIKQNSKKKSRLKKNDWEMSNFLADTFCIWIFELKYVCFNSRISTKKSERFDFRGHIYLSQVYKNLIYFSIFCSQPFFIQCNLDLVTLLVSAKTVTKSHNVMKSNNFI